MQPINTAQTFSSKQEAKMYLNAKLNEYAKIVAKLAQNREMQKLVNKKVAERFDDDYNVLLKNLTNRPTTENFSLKKVLQMSTTPIQEHSPMQQQLDLGELEAALIEPLTINGQVLYPQIYIPFFEEQENFSEPIEPTEPGDPTDPNPCLNAVINPLEPLYLNPVIVPYDGQEVSGQDTFLGSTYDQNGVLIENIPVDECFAKRHRVWAIKLNERTELGGANPTVIANTPTPSAQNIAQAAFIKEMKIKVNKESWIKGANDLEISWSMSWEDGINPITNTYAVHPFELKFWVGYEMKYTSTITLGKFSRKDVKRGRTKDLNIDYAVFGNPTSFVAAGGEWNSMRDWYNRMGTYIYYAVYERDAWADIDVPVAIPFPKWISYRGKLGRAF